MRERCSEGVLVVQREVVETLCRHLGLLSLSSSLESSWVNHCGLPGNTQETTVVHGKRQVSTLTKFKEVSTATRLLMQIDTPASFRLTFKLHPSVVSSELSGHSDSLLCALFSRHEHSLRFLRPNKLKSCIGQIFETRRRTR